jgi:hypothetical protein
VITDYVSRAKYKRFLRLKIRPIVPLSQISTKKAFRINQKNLAPIHAKVFLIKTCEISFFKEFIGKKY